jgi:carbon monoxide dehydrogenase subunit G
VDNVKIEGTYTFPVTRDFVWMLLQDPVVIKRALPGCEEFDQIAASDFVVAMRIEHGPFKGLYQGHLQFISGDQADRFVMNVDGTGPEGAVRGQGMLHFDEQDGSTFVHYAGDVIYTGPIAEKSPRLVQTTANALIRQFFEAIDQQVQLQTGVHTTSLSDGALRARPSRSIDMEDVVAKIRQDRRTVWLVLILLAFAIFSMTGALVFLLLLVRWGKRLFDRRVAKAVQEHQESISLENP